MVPFTELIAHLLDGVHSGAGFPHLVAGPLDDASSLIFYREIQSYLNAEFQAFGARLFERMMEWAGAVSLTLLTLWIILRGYRITTGQSRDSMAVFVADMAKAVAVIGVATGTAIAGGTLYDWVCNQLPNQINRLVADHDGDLYATIDRTFGYMQVGLSSIGDILTADNALLEAAKTRNQGFVIAGTGMPALVAGALLLFYQAMLAMIVGFAPLGVLSLLFKRTESFFWNWLLTLLSTLVAMAVLSVMASYLLDVVCAVAASFWAGQLMGSNPEGINSLALQQGGLGLIFTTLMIAVPPAIARIFKGLLGDFIPHSAFGAGWSAPFARNAHTQGHAHYTHADERADAPTPTHAHRVSAPAQVQADEVKLAEDTRSFAERYPNALASNDLIGGCDPLPKQLHFIVTKTTDAIHIDADGYIQNADIIKQPVASLEKGAIEGPKAIVLHRTDSSTAEGALASFNRGVGTHFLIDKDGTIYQAASLSQKTAHVGKIKSRCYEEQTCSAEEAQIIKNMGFAPGKLHNREKVKDYPDRYPMNEDSVGIETVMLHVDGKWEEPTPAQTASIKRLVGTLQDQYGLDNNDVYEHDKISYKTPGEGAGLYDPIDDPVIPIVSPRFPPP